MPFGKATQFEVVGAWVAVVSCDECGALILLDPRDDINELELHEEWHRRNTPQETFGKSGESND